MTDTGRTYGGWLRPRSPGIWGLSTIGSISVLGSLIVAIMLLASAGWQIAVAFAVLAGPPMALFYYKNRAGRDGWQIVGGHAGWWWRKQRKTHLFYRARIGEYAHGQLRLPGLLADSELLEAEDMYGQPIGIIHYRKARHYAVCVAVDPDGGSLVDEDTHDTWVARFGQFQAQRGYDQSLVGWTVTVETAPDAGHRLSAEIGRLQRSDGPDLSKQVLEEIRARYPQGAAAVSAHVCFTYDARQNSQRERELTVRDGGKRPRDEAAMCAVIVEQLPTLIAELGQCGVGNAQTMTAQQLAEHVYVAFHPEKSSTVDDCRTRDEPTGIMWASAGPAAALADWNSYRHDDAVSVTSEMAEAPKGAVVSRVLEPLLKANDKIDRKRVTWIYRPHDPATAPAIADSDKRAAFGHMTGRKGMARSHDEKLVEATTRAAQAEANGAGLTRLACLVTATVSDEARLDDAAGAAERAGRQAHLLLRPCYGTQDSSFTAALGVGVILNAHTNISDRMRRGL